MTAILNKRVLLAAGIIVAMAAAVLGATYAAWSASDTIDNNSLSTATLSITAAGVVGSGGAQPLPFDEDNVLPGDVSDPLERAIITNGSTVPLDLYMYVGDVVGPACGATKLAWQSREQGGAVYYGFALGAVLANVGDIAVAGDDNFTLLSDLTGPTNKVLVADAANFENGDEVVMRQAVGFADDAIYGTHSGGCDWTLYFVGETI